MAEYPCKSASKHLRLIYSVSESVSVGFCKQTRIPEDRVFFKKQVKVLMGYGMAA
jgi:hypothetical protein